MTTTDRLRLVRDRVKRLLCLAQDIRIQQVQACSEAAWEKHLTDRSNRSWIELNKESEAIEAELGKMIAECL